MALAKASGRMGGEMDSVEGMASEFVEPASESAYNMIVSSATFLGFFCKSLVKCYNATYNVVQLKIEKVNLARHIFFREGGTLCCLLH